MEISAFTFHLTCENQTHTVVPLNIFINPQNLTQSHPLPAEAALSINPFIMEWNYSMTNLSVRTSAE